MCLCRVPPAPCQTLGLEQFGPLLLWGTSFKALQSKLRRGRNIFVLENYHHILPCCMKITIQSVALIVWPFIWWRSRCRAVCASITLICCIYDIKIDVVINSRCLWKFAFLFPHLLFLINWQYLERRNGERVSGSLRFLKLNVMGLVCFWWYETRFHCVALAGIL